MNTKGICSQRKQTICQFVIMAESPYLCPDSWAMVNANPRPVSSLMVQLRYLLHIPLIGAKPEEKCEHLLIQTEIAIS